ncbi:MAG: HD domain-containing protein [Candidatus Omnitrophica bacterium]|nr:HD domain-containing protein [Candidatus Omnitrophota bacterium]
MINQRYGSVSYNFKIAMVMLLFVLTSLRLAQIIYFPENEIISDKILLFVVFFVVAYLWVQELRDYTKLAKLHRELGASHDQLKEAEIDTITSLINAVEAKDPYTCGHSERVTKIALAIADEMELGEESKAIIARVGILHDIGKIGISDAILHKKEQLTEEEWDAIKAHPEKAVHILEPLKFLSVVRNIIMSHHERYNGSGYPRGLKGQDICIEALILAVADAFDAMNSRRAYREPMSKESIVKELTTGRGTQHSATVVDALFKVLDKKPRLWER